MNLSKAIEAAAEALDGIRLDEAWVDCQDPRVPDHGGNQCGAGAHVLDPKDVARIAVEAAAPILLRYTGSLHQIAQERAERAEAEVEQLKKWAKANGFTAGVEENQYADTKLMRALQRAERAEILVEEWVENKKDWVERAERAEIEVERLRDENHRSIGNEIWLAERRLADELAAALQASFDKGWDPNPALAALARWEEARRG